MGRFCVSSPSRPATPKRRAFTLIELLVIVMVIGGLIALILPAVQAAREASRRAGCITNLRQIGIALHHYESAHGMFPPAGLDDPRKRRGSLAIELSGLLYLLPHLEQQTLYAGFNFDLATMDGPESPIVENRTVRHNRLAVFLCPSDGEPIHLNSYRFNSGRYGAGANHGMDGPFGFMTSTRAASITDGLSTTAFMSEGLGGSFGSGASGPPRDVKYLDAQAYPGPYNSNATYIPACLSDPSSLYKRVSGRYWTYLGFTNTGYNHEGTPNDRRPSCGGPGVGQFDQGLYPPRSLHRGIVHVLKGDGHAESIADTIQQQVWTALGTPDAGDF
jgi:competence protein ComGC